MGKVFFRKNYNICESSLDFIRKQRKIETELYIGKLVNVKVSSIGDFNGQPTINGDVYSDNNEKIAKFTSYYSSLSDNLKSYIDDDLVSEGDVMKLYVTKIFRKEKEPGVFLYYTVCSDKKPSEKRIERSKEVLKKILSTPFPEARCASTIQNIPVEIKISITDHAILRKKERLNIHWDDILLKTDFVEKTIQEIINDSRNVNRFKKFIFQNTKTDVTSVLFFNNIDLTEGDVLLLDFTLITLWKGLYDEDQTYNHRNQYIIKGDSSSIAYKTLNSTSNTYTLQTIVPIKFNVNGQNSNRAMIQQLKLTDWNNSSPLSVAVGCIRKTLPQIFFNNILKREGRTFVCYEPTGPIYVGVKYYNYNNEENCLDFALVFIQHGDNFKYNEDEHIYTTQDQYYKIIKNIKNTGTVLKHEDYIDKKITYK